MTFAEHFPQAEIHSFDIAESVCDIGNRYFGYKQMAKVKFFQADITAFKPDRKYDLISCKEVLEHIDDWVSVVKTMAQCSEKYLLISVPIGRMRKYEAITGHLRNYQKGEIEAAAGKLGFRPVKVFYAGFPFLSLYRDILQIFPSVHNDAIHYKMTAVSKLLHHCAYILLRYFSAKRFGGELFFGLFEKGPAPPHEAAL